MKEVQSLSDLSMYLYPLFTHEVYLQNYIIDDNYKILDNGIFELNKVPSNKSYLDLIKKINPHEVIAPDIPNNLHNTLTVVKKFISNFLSIETSRLHIQAVIQAKTLEEAVICYQSYIENSNIHCIGIPYKLQLSSSSKGVMSRKDFIFHLLDKKIYSNKKGIHLLGANSIGELEVLSKTRIIRSCDSSIFFRHARDGIDYQKEIPQTRTYNRINHLSNNSNCIKLLQSNIIYLNRILL